MLKIGQEVKHDTFGVGVIRLTREGYRCAYGVAFKKAPKSGHDLRGTLSSDNGLWCRESRLTPTGKVAKVAFVLVYDLESGDPVETFETRAQLTARLRELADSRTLVRDSVQIFEVKKALTAKIGTNVTIR